jgi:hypothetical protein
MVTQVKGSSGSDVYDFQRTKGKKYFTENLYAFATYNPKVGPSTGNLNSVVYVSLCFYH